MGKYMRKGKGMGEVAVMEVLQSSLGVKTTARTLASQEDQKLVPSMSTSIKHPTPTTTTSTAAAMKTTCVESKQTSYSEFRSRKLEKISRCYHAQEGNNNNKESKSLEESSRLGLSEPSAEAAPAKVARKQSIAGPSEALEEPTNDEEATLEVRHTWKYWQVEALFGENIMDHNSRERNVETLETLGSTTKPAQASSGRKIMQTEAQMSHFHVPTSSEIEEFFAGAEQQERRQFVERDKMFHPWKGVLPRSGPRGPISGPFWKRKRLGNISQPFMVASRKHRAHILKLGRFHPYTFFFSKSSLYDVIGVGKHPFLKPQAEEKLDHDPNLHVLVLIGCDTTVTSPFFFICKGSMDGIA
eukprot:Gb_39154 [translate_table: standard]